MRQELSHYGSCCLLALLARSECNTHPIANVRQSEAGARAVIGSKMVLAERCSDVEGSKRMMLPCALPVASSARVWAVASWTSCY